MSELRFRRAALHPARITLVWPDDEAVEPMGLNDRTPTLVNDLETSLTSPSGNFIERWTPDPTRPTGPAERGHNVRDNVERIEILSADADEKGGWTLRVVGRPWPNAMQVEAALGTWWSDHLQ